MIAFSLTTVLAQADAADSIPSSAAEIRNTILGTLGRIWESLLERTPFFVAGLLVLVATGIVVAVIKSLLRPVLRKRDIRESLGELILRFVSVLIWFLGLFVVAVIVFPGLDPANALGGLGLLSVAIGFAFQDIFENFFAGILLLWRFPFENGDTIECEGITGVVEEVQIRMTKIRRTTGELVVVPNSFLFKNPVEILTNQPTRRIHLTVGVAYGEDVEESVGVIREAMERCETVDAGQPLQIYPKEFGSSSIDIDVAWWTSARPGDRRKSKGEAITAIKKALDEAGIEIPFPYRTLTFHEPLSLADEREG